MSRFELLELIQQDIKDIKSLIKFDEYGMNQEEMKTMSRGIILNLEDHFEDFIKLNNKKKKPTKKLKNHLCGN
jgi:hypothetical protein